MLKVGFCLRVGNATVAAVDVAVISDNTRREKISIRIDAKHPRSAVNVNGNWRYQKMKIPFLFRSPPKKQICAP